MEQQLAEMRALCDRLAANPGADQGRVKLAAMMLDVLQLLSDELDARDREDPDE